MGFPLKRENASIDALIDELELSFSDCSDELPETAAVTFWLPVDVKAKYDLLQSRSKRKFAAALREILITAITKVRVD